jgi:quercetin dioxygenase-like cupin family protein
MEKCTPRAALEVSGFDTVMEGADMRVLVLTLAADECAPWHYHSEITDRFFCLAGPMVVETRAPRAVNALEAGDSCSVPPKTAHYVHGKDNGPCRFLVLQGVGIYDNVPVGSGKSMGSAARRV